MAKTPTPKIITKKHLAKLERERIQNRIIVMIAVVVLVIVLGVIGYGILDQSVLRARRPVAKVGNEIITTSDFQKQVRYFRFQLIQQYNSTKQLMGFFGSDPNNSAYFQQSLQQIASELADNQTLGQTVLDRMINDRVIKQEAQKRGISVSQEEIDKAMQDAFGYYPNGTPTPTITPTLIPSPTLNPTELSIVTITPTPTNTSIPTATPSVTSTPTAAPTGAQTGTPAANPTQNPTAAVTTTPEGASTPIPTDTPEPTATPYTFDGYQGQVKNYLDQVKSLGFTQQDLNDLFLYTLYREKLTTDVTKELKPEEEEVWARHILLPDEPTALAVEERLKRGEDFAKVAEQVSTDPGSKSQGGDLGWFGRGVMDPDFENAAFTLQPGQISQPVKTTNGYHIIQVIGHEVRPLNGSQFINFKNTTFQNWLTDQVSKDNVIKFDNVWQNNIPVEPTLPPDQTGQ